MDEGVLAGSAFHVTLTPDRKVVWTAETDVAVVQDDKDREDELLGALRSRHRAPAAVRGTALTGLTEGSGLRQAQTTSDTAPARIRGRATIRISDFTTLPNLLSLARIGGVAAAVLLYFGGHPYVTLVLGTAACLTDNLDGYLARRLSQETVLGAMLDQAADSFTTAIAMAMLVVAGVLPFVVLVIYLLREFWVHTVRRYAALSGFEIPSHVSGKLATAFIYWSMLLMAITLMLDIPREIAAILRPLAGFGMAVGLGLSCASGLRYTRVLAGKVP